MAVIRNGLVLLQIGASWQLLLTGPSLVGGWIGSRLVTRLPPSYFDALVPWLLLTASLLFIAQPTLTRRFPPRGDGRLPSWRGCTVLVLFQFLVALYGGYFGAAQGVLVIGLLGTFLDESIQRVNGAKNVLVAIVNGTAAVVYIIFAHVAWLAVLLIAVGSTLGGFLGAKFGRKLPPQALRVFVVLIGVISAVKLIFF